MNIFILSIYTSSLIYNEIFRAISARIIMFSIVSHAFVVLYHPMPTVGSTYMPKLHSNRSIGFFSFSISFVYLLMCDSIQIKVTDNPLASA